MKLVAYGVSGSVGILSDALESTTNIIAAVIALLALRRAALPPNERFHFGQGKAEYFSALVEGALIFAAALVIIAAATERLLHGGHLKPDLGIGLAVSTVASGFNAATALVLSRAGRKHRSLVLIADAKHLMADVWTSAGVLVGVGLVALTDYQPLDPVVAILVAGNIVVTGYKLMRDSITGLMDVALPAEDLEVIATVLNTFRSDSIDMHQVQTRGAGRHRFIAFHLLVPGTWSVQEGYDLGCNIERALHEALPDAVVNISLQPADDPRSHEDQHEGQHRLW
ncbi:MAG TPA: cation-efflux pump [Actinobacteria bacterium]|nr:cation-efflux pump [Actinomycetota bacterium]